MFNQAAVSVSYPTARTLNQLTFSSNQQQQHQPPPQQQPPHIHQSTQQASSSQSHSKFSTNRNCFSGTGNVTNIQGDFGVIDDECCFYRQNCVKSIMPKLGERVLVEATTNHKNVNYKWQATRVQVLSPSSSSSTANLSSSSSKPPTSSMRDGSVEIYRSRRDYSPPRRSSPRRRSRERSPRRNDALVRRFNFIPKIL